ncbi:hypothetical protein [Paucidesulfovibrio longus]|uniref:hypothetical protein n=1 Tax=Paucidesulfovibrio longus TaxID=889 RepID=UPI0003B6F177|nr:hypothetical protein [Paucidesulfovibrio longus]
MKQDKLRDPDRFAGWGRRALPTSLLLAFFLALSAWPALAASQAKWPVGCEFRGLNETLAEHRVDADSLPLFMGELAGESELLASASLYVTEDRDKDVHGFEYPTGKARFVLTLNLKDGVVLETRENVCSWERLDRCLRREVKDALRIYRNLAARHGVKPGSRILNL